MSTADQHIVGSAEPLSPEQTRARLHELKEWGVDLSLVQANLELTPTQRIEAALNLLALAQEMRRAWEKRQVVAANPGTRQEGRVGPAAT